MSTKSQCAAIIATFKNRWFDTGIAFDHLRATRGRNSMAAAFSTIQRLR